MRIYLSHHSILVGLMLAVAAGCAPQAQAPPDNPIADALVSQAKQLNAMAQACRQDAAAYRAHSQEATVEACTGEGILQVSQHSQSGNQCAAGMIGQINSCQRWDSAYQAMIASNEGDTAREHVEVELMETEELLRSH